MTLDELRPFLRYPLVTVRQVAVLLVLADSKGMPLRKIAECLNMPRPSMSRAFDALVRAKLIKRVRCVDDRRDVYGELTELGKGMLG